MSWLPAGLALALVLPLSCNKHENRVPAERSMPNKASRTSKPAPSSRPPPSCKSDLDCNVCGTRTGCRCQLAPSPECGDMEHPCVAPPCHDRSASCWQGKCALRPASAAPCTADDDCEVRDDACRCDIFAALKTAPVAKECEGQGCGTRPAKSQYRARCDASAQRCVLERAAEP